MQLWETQKEHFYLIDVTDKIEHPSTFIGRSLWVNRRSWPRKAIGHRVLPSIYRSFTIRPRLPLKTFVGDVTFGLFVSAQFLGDPARDRRRARLHIQARR